MKVLCINSGSSSIKFKLYDGDEILCSGIVERVTVGGSFCLYERPYEENIKIEKECPTHYDGIKLVIDTITHKNYGVIDKLSEISAVAHRVVHGYDLTRSCIITNEILDKFKTYANLAPLHNPANILGIEVAKELIKDVPHIAVLETAWHSTIPSYAYIYGLPYKWYEKYKIKRYGNHGISFLYNAKRGAVLLGKDPFKCSLIICHIGQGSEINAVKNGISYDTSQGFTPLEGLIMGTRAGDHDAAIDFFIMKEENISPAKMYDILHKESGIFGISGYKDRRDVKREADLGNERAKLAIDVETYRIKKYIGAYFAALGNVDAIIFTGGAGAGEAVSDIIREKALSGLESLGIKIDYEKNNLAKTRNAECDITHKYSKIKIFVVPTDEERVMLEDTIALIEGKYDFHTNFEYSFQKPNYRNKLRDMEFDKECEKRPMLRKVVANIPTHIVTCFIKHNNKILLLKRSGKVGTYKNKWAAVSGYMEKEPIEQAYTEIQEEINVSRQKLKLIKVGESFSFYDDKINKTWVVHPFLFYLNDIKEIKINWENIETKWISIDELKNYDTVPKLYEALMQVL